MIGLTHRLNSAIRNGIQRLPPRWRLPVLAMVDQVQGAIEVENVEVPRLIPMNQRLVALDVGANNGVTTAILSKVFREVHAFEPHPLMADDLANAGLPNVTVHPLAASEGAGEAELVIPISQGVTMTGWGSLTGSLLDQFADFQRIKVATLSIDSLNLAEVDYIKIDVEGHELDVLKGTQETIRRWKPWLVVEALGEQQLAVINFLQPLGYSKTDLQQLSGTPGTEHNLIFKPAL